MCVRTISGIHKNQMHIDFQKYTRHQWYNMAYINICSMRACVCVCAHVSVYLDMYYVHTRRITRLQCMRAHVCINIINHSAYVPWLGSLQCSSLCSCLWVAKMATRDWSFPSSVAAWNWLGNAPRPSIFNENQAKSITNINIQPLEILDG